MSDDDLATRFWAKVQKTATCWHWKAQTNPKGYGRFWDGTRYVQAHRFAYETMVGPIGAGLQLDHLCRARACVNPAHLEPVTSRENTLRGFGPTATNSRRTACVHGHPYTPENTFVYADETGAKARLCRTCHRARSRKYYRASLEVAS